MRAKTSRLPGPTARSVTAMATRMTCSSCVVAFAVGVGVIDGTAVEVGVAEAARVEVGVADAGPVEVGVADGAAVEVGVADATLVEVGVADGAAVEVGVADAGPVEVGVADASTVEGSSETGAVSEEEHATNVSPASAIPSNPAVRLTVLIARLPLEITDISCRAAGSSGASTFLEETAVLEVPGYTGLVRRISLRDAR